MQKYSYTYILFDILRNQYQIDYEFRNTKSSKRKKKYIRNYKKNAKYVWQLVATRNYCFTSRVNTL